MFPGERHFLEIASLEPSFAGFFMEGDVLVAHVSDPSRHSEVRAALTSRLGDVRRGRAAPDRVETRDVDFSFLQLARWRNLAHHHLFDMKDVVSLDMDERANRVSRTIDSSNPRFEIVGTAASYPAAGDTVHKMGSSSAGWTYGAVKKTCKERFFEWDPDVDYRITCAFEADFRLDGGDSGGPVFTWLGGNDVILEGIGIGHDGRYGTGGEGIFSPYLAIEEDLSDDFLQAWNEPLSGFIPGPWDAPPNEPCTWYSNVWGGRAPYSYQWSGALTGTNSTVTGVISESSYLSLTVTDADSNQDVDSRLIEVGEVEECVY